MTLLPASLLCNLYPAILRCLQLCVDELADVKTQDSCHGHNYDLTTCSQLLKRTTPSSMTTDSGQNLNCGNSSGQSCLKTDQSQPVMPSQRATRSYVSERIAILLKILVTLPVTTATAERSFSTLKRPSFSHE